MSVLKGIWEAYEESRFNEGGAVGTGRCGLAMLPERGVDMLEWDVEHSNRRGARPRNDFQHGRYREEYDLEYRSSPGCDTGFEGFGPEELDIDSLHL